MRFSAFRLSLLLKGADGILEVIGGILVLVVSPATLSRVAVALTQHELSEDPHDLVATSLRAGVAHLIGGGRLFAAAYLLAHGVGKIVLVVEILRGRLWAYPAMLLLLGFFIVYQTYRLTHGFTVGMLALTILDVIIVALTWREYRRLRATRV